MQRVVIVFFVYPLAEVSGFNGNVELNKIRHDFYFFPRNRECGCRDPGNLLRVVFCGGSKTYAIVQPVESQFSQVFHRLWWIFGRTLDVSDLFGRRNVKSH